MSIGTSVMLSNRVYGLTKEKQRLVFPDPKYNGLLRRISEMSATKGISTITFQRDDAADVKQYNDARGEPMYTHQWKKGEWHSSKEGFNGENL